MPDGAAGRGAPAPATDPVLEGVPRGSLRHLAVLFSGAPEPSLIEAIYAFEAELRRVVAAASHEAAHARLQWWRGELDRLVAGRPTHPLAQALLALREQRGADAGLLHEMIVAADLDLTRITYATWQELEAYLFRSAGVPQTLIAATLSSGRGLQPAERDFARRLGSALRQTEIIVGLDRDLARGFLYAPVQALDAAGIDPQAFARRTARDGVHAFVTDWSGRVHAELEALPLLLDDPVQRRAQRHGLVLAALHARWLERWLASSGAARSRAELASMTRLWTAWRTAVRHS